MISLLAIIAADFLGMKTAEVLTLLSIVLGGGFITALIAIYKAKPERDAVVVSSAQNAAEILKGLNTALYAELERVRTERDAAEREVSRLEKLCRANSIEIPTQGEGDVAGTAS